MSGFAPIRPSLLLIRIYVKEPAVWVENRRIQRTQKREVRLPLLSIFKWGMLFNTLTGCWWMASGFVTGYSQGGMFPTYLQKEVGLSPAFVALPVMLQSLMFFLSSFFWGRVADRVGRRSALILPVICGIVVTPFYLLTHNYAMIVFFFAGAALRAAACMRRTRPISPSVFRPRSARPQAGSATTQRNLRRADRTSADLFRRQHTSRICYPHVDRNDGWLRQLHSGAAL